MTWAFGAVITGGAVLGFAGSGHCALMCGPLLTWSAAAAPSPGFWPRARHIALYHAGRMAVYAALGAMTGAAGAALAHSGVGRAAAYVAAAALIGHVLVAWRRRASPAPSSFDRVVLLPAERVTGRLAGALAAWMRRRSVAGPAASGALTGLLPCGMLYAALIAAAGFGGVRDAAVFMIAFGAGSAPALSALAAGASRLGRAAPRRAAQLAPFALLLIAVLLVVRAQGGSSTAHASHARQHQHRP